MIFVKAPPNIQNVGIILFFYKSPSLINSSLSLEGVGEEGKDRKICDSFEE